MKWEWKGVKERLFDKTRKSPILEHVISKNDKTEKIAFSKTGEKPHEIGISFFKTQYFCIVWKGKQQGKHVHKMMYYGHDIPYVRG